MLYPIIPQTITKALRIFDIDEKDISFSSITNHKYLKSEKKLNKIGILFKKIEKNND